MAGERTGSDQAITEGDGENFGDTKIVPEDGEAGIDDPGEDGADRHILGKKQEDLTAEDLAGDTRSSGTE